MRLKIALPNECNDPFEFTPRSRMTITPRLLRKKLENDPEHFRLPYNKLVEHGFSRSFSEFLKALPHQKQSSKERKILRDALTTNDLDHWNQCSSFFGVLCLSAVNDSIPMWSHYSHDHRGVVIGVRKGDAAYANAIAQRKIKYVKHRVSVDPVVLREKWWNDFKRTVFSKSCEWDYEQEFRMIFHLKELLRGNLDGKRNAYFVNLWESTIASVIFGCLISPRDENRIRKLLGSKKRFSNVKLFRACRNPKQFSLQIVPAE